MQTVCRADTALLDRPRDPVNPRGEVRLRAVHGRPYASGCSSVPARGTGSRHDRRRSSCIGTRRCGVRRSASHRGRASATASSGSTRSRLRGVRRRAQPRAGSRARPLVPLRRPGAQPRDHGRRGLRRRLRDRARLARDGFATRTSSSRRSTRWESRSPSSHATRLRSTRGLCGDRSSGAPRAVRTGFARGLHRVVPPPALDRRLRLGRGGRSSRALRRDGADSDVRPVRRGHRVLPAAAFPHARRRRRLGRSRSPARLRALPRTCAQAARPLLPARRLGRAPRALGAVPANVQVEADVPFPVVRDRLAGARVVALPVRDNTYSGATTTLLQAMASGKPVVVTRTAAIARGYHLEDGANCRLVPPGDLAALEHAVSGVLDDADAAAKLGAGARETVELHLTWRQYTDAIREHLLAATRRIYGSRVSVGRVPRAALARSRRAAEPSCARSRPRSTSSVPAAEDLPTSRSSTSSCRHRPVAGTSSCERSPGSSTGAA